MRNANENAPKGTDEKVRATFEIPRPLYAEFCGLAKRRDRTFSSALRTLIREELDRDSGERAAA